jgi:hypothetical protein
MQYETTSTDDLIHWQILDDFCTQHPNFNRSQIEWLYRNRERNGLKGVFRRIGKRRYIHAGRFASALLEGKG